MIDAPLRPLIPMRPIGLRGSPIQPCDGRSPVPNRSQYCALSHPIEIGLCAVLYEAESNWQVLIPVYAEPKEGSIKTSSFPPLRPGSIMLLCFMFIMRSHLFISLILLFR